MTTTHLTGGAARLPRRRPRRKGRGVLSASVMVSCALIVGAAAFIAHVLWPTWPGAVVAPDAPSIPVTVAGVAFNVPPAAIRMPVQRRAGAHERLDLAYLWPSLVPPDPNASAPAPGAAAASKPLDRIFATLSAAGDKLPPAERIKTIYPRYLAAEPVAQPNGLAVQAFRDDTPYRGEDLAYDAAAPGKFVVRCSRNGAGQVPGTCLYERRIDTADIVARFPRDWLADWRFVDGTIERMIKSLRPPAAQ
jgi:hypothetical protein